MNLPRLEISQQYAKISLETTRSQLNLATTAPQLQLHTEAAVLELSQPRGQLTIDTYPCRYDLGLKNSEDLLRDAAEAGRQAALEAVGRIAAEGDRLMNFKGEPQAIANISRENTDTPEVSLDWGYKRPPTIRYEPEPVRLEARRGEVQLQLQRGTVDAQLQRGTVTVSMAQYPSVTIRPVGGVFDGTA